MSMREHNAYLVGWTSLAIIVLVWAVLWWTSDEGRMWRRRVNAWLDRTVNPRARYRRGQTYVGWVDTGSATIPLMDGRTWVHTSTNATPSGTVMVFRPLPRPYDWKRDGDGHDNPLWPRETIMAGIED